MTTSDSVDATTRGGLDANQVSAFYDFLTNNYGDMVNIDMKIMGDPAYIGEDYFTLNACNRLIYISFFV